MDLILDLRNEKRQGVCLVNYKKSCFPDGQHDLEFTNPEQVKGKTVMINSYCRSFVDLELIACAVVILRNLEAKEIHLYIPYLIGARSDMRFKDGGTNYLPEVIAPFINNLNLNSITVLDVHSAVAAGCIQRLKSKSNEEFVKNALTKIGEKYKCETMVSTGKNYYLPSEIVNGTKTVLVSPDAGAYKKIFKLADSIGLQTDILTCSKARDKEGKIASVQVPNIEQHLEKDFIIIDDICDGGRTFVNIAEVIQNTPGFKGKVFLIVTHGIFSAGLENLAAVIDKVYTTDSFDSPVRLEHSNCYNNLSIYPVWL